MTGLFGWRVERLLHPVAEPLPAPDPAQVATLAARLEKAGRRARLRPSRLLLVGTGGCGSCRLEVAALDGPVLDVGRAGLSFVGSPLEAEILVVTGPGARNAAGPLRRAYEAMSGARYVIGIGDCTAGLGSGAGYALHPEGVGAVVPVDLAVRGAPPPPEAILLGVLTLCEAAVK